MPRPPLTNVDQPRAVRAPTTVPDPVTTPLLKVSTAHEYNLIPGMGRTARYEAVKRGDLPSVRVGRRLYIPTAALLARLGLTAPAAAPQDAA